MNVSIYPSLLALADRKEDWASEIALVESFSSGIHFDIGDGDFVPSRMLDPVDIALVQTELPIDVHLMVQRPSEYFEKILSFPGVTAIAFHVECQEDIHEHIQCLHNAGKKV